MADLHTNADAAPRLTLALVERAAIRAGAIARLDAAIGQADAITATSIARIRAGCRALGADDEEIERHIAAFMREVADPERAWFVAQRNRAALGVTAGMLVAPPQV
jgi:hypothetical protein